MVSVTLVTSVVLWITVWFVTEPDEFAIGLAVAETPPTSAALTGEDTSNAITG